VYTVYTATPTTAFAAVGDRPISVELVKEGRLDKDLHDPLRGKTRR
jgi:hypothetical protein